MEMIYNQGYHRSRIKNVNDFGKLYFPTQNKTLFREIVSVCMTNVRSYICIFTSRHNLFQQCLIIIRKKLVHLEFLLAIVTENVFSFAYFLTQLNAKLTLKRSPSHLPNQPRELTMLRMPDNALCLCAARLH